MEDIQTELAHLKNVLKSRLELERMMGVERLHVTIPVLEPLGGTAAAGTTGNSELDALEARAQACTACALSKTRSNVVFGVGRSNARLMFVGEAPGFHEDKQGEPFVGPAGKLLNKIIKAINLSREQVYIANVLKCRPPNNRDPKPEEIIACRELLSEQVRLINPEVIVALGAPAARTLLDQPSAAIGRLRGRFHDFGGTPLMPTYHPAYLLRNYTEDTRRKVWEDMQKVRDRLAGS